MHAASVPAGGTVPLLVPCGGCEGTDGVDAASIVSCMSLAFWWHARAASAAGVTHMLVVIWWNSSSTTWRRQCQSDGCNSQRLTDSSKSMLLYSACSFLHQLNFTKKHSAPLQLLHEDYALTFPTMSIARQSFIQVSELGNCGKNGKSQRFKMATKGIWTTGFESDILTLSYPTLQTHCLDTFAGKTGFGGDNYWCSERVKVKHDRHMTRLL